MTTRDDGSPVLVLSSVSFIVNVRHSGLLSNNLSETTIPHLLQIISPDLGSVIIALSVLHEGHNVKVSNAEFTLSSFFDLFIQHLIRRNYNHVVRK